MKSDSDLSPPNERRRIRYRAGQIHVVLNFLDDLEQRLSPN